MVQGGLRDVLPHLHLLFLLSGTAPSPHPSGSCAAQALRPLVRPRPCPSSHSSQCVSTHHVCQLLVNREFL